MPEALNPVGGSVNLGRIRLRTPGLQGTAEIHQPATSGSRSAAQSTSDLDEALRNEGVRAAETIELRNTREVPTGGAGTRSTSYGKPAIELDVPAPGEKWGQVVLAIDESGVVTWNFPVATTGQTGATRGGTGGVQTYVIRRYVPETPAAPGSRGIVGAIGKKVLKVLVFPLVEDVAGEVGDYFAHRWEQKKRPYRVRAFGPDDYQTPDADIIDGGGWERLSSGRSLLLVHGTFSRAHTGFGGFERETIAELHRRYEGRVFAFDHFTLSEDPRQNVDWLLGAIPDGTSLDLDVLCHSRGGLVSRVLAERQAELSLGSRSLRVDKVVFAATPNGGTILADAEHHGALIDSVTNLLQFVPDNGVTEVLETVITVAKHIAVGAAKGLEGLESMRPGGPFIKALNAGPKGDTAYFALASNFEPTNHGWQVFAKDRLMDALFNKENDLVVPTGGVHEANDSGCFPIADPLVFARADGIGHSDFFRKREAVDKILAWLQP
ncbi:MAG: hypothetical protein H0V37_14565 [Chloroflexia bacterium]|nr:hypothetical protein [Chloroflexia bacterium]